MQVHYPTKGPSEGGFFQIKWEMQDSVTSPVGDETYFVALLRRNYCQAAAKQDGQT